MKRNYGCSALVLAALALAVGTDARAAVVVTLPKAGSYTAWVTDPKDTVLAGPSTVDGTKAVLDTGAAKNSGAWMLVVEDSKTGNAAVKKVPPGESPRVALAADAFDRIGRVVVNVTDKKGKSPTVAAVTLTDGKGVAHSTTLRPSDAGQAVFHDVASGDGSVRVQQGDPENQQTMTVRLPLDHEQPVLALTTDVALPDGMKTQDTAPGTTGHPGAQAEEGKQGTAKPAASRNGLSSLIGFIIALVVLGGAAFFLLRMMRTQGVTARSALAKAGIQLPDDEPEPITTVAAEAPQTVDPTVCPFCGAKKDASGACPNCAVGANPAGAPAAYTTAASGGGRRLVALTGPLAGSVFPISEALSVGRETGQDVAITDDPSLSRHHAVVESRDGGIVIADQGSSNGTWVNGQRIQTQALRPGDEITLGASRFRYEE